MLNPLWIINHVLNTRQHCAKWLGICLFRVICTIFTAVSLQFQTQQDAEIGHARSTDSIVYNLEDLRRNAVVQLRKVLENLDRSNLFLQYNLCIRFGNGYDILRKFGTMAA